MTQQAAEQDKKLSQGQKSLTHLHNICLDKFWSSYSKENDYRQTFDSYPHVQVENFELRILG